MLNLLSIFINKILFVTDTTEENKWYHCRRADIDNITSRDLINILKWDSLARRRKMSRLCMLYKAVNGEVARPTHILQTADHRVHNSAHKYKHLPAKENQPLSTHFTTEQ